jgi:hypothetical protein
VVVVASFFDQVSRLQPGLHYSNSANSPQQDRLKPAQKGYTHHLKVVASNTQKPAEAG